MKLSTFLQTERNEVTIAGTFTRVDYLRIKQINLTIETSELHIPYIPWLFLPTRFFIIA